MVIITFSKKRIFLGFLIILVAVFVYYTYFLGPFPLDNNCFNSVDRGMKEFKVAIEDSVARIDSVPLNFSPEEGCFSSSNKSNLIIYLEETRPVCDAVCGFDTNNCYIMKFSSVVNGSVKRKCLNLPQYTIFEFGNSCKDQDLISSGYTTIDPTIQGTLLPGSYVIRNVSPAGDPFPLICMWYKK